MQNCEGFELADNVQDLKNCPICDNRIWQEFPNIVNTPFFDGRRGTFYTWSCVNCKKELISYQKIRVHQNGETLAQS